MSKIAILSDVHANLQALKAVLRDIGEAGMDSVICLGDVVGYGANPSECIDLLRAVKCPGVIGNHDFYTCSDSLGVTAALEDPDSVGNPVWEGIRHAKAQLNSDQMDWLRRRGRNPSGSAQAWSEYRKEARWR